MDGYNNNRAHDWAFKERLALGWIGVGSIPTTGTIKFFCQHPCTHDFFFLYSTM